MYKVKSKNKIHTMFYVFFVLLILIIFLSFNYYAKSLEPVSSMDKKPINIDIPSSSSTKNIGEILEKNNLIKNKWIFLLKVKTLDNKAYLKAGNYSLSKSMDLEEILNALIEGGRSGNTISFTIPEGYEIKDIAEKLEKEGLINLDKFLILVSEKENFEGEFSFLKHLDKEQSLEGFLFPSTYEVYENHSEEDIIRKMLEGFEEIYIKDIEKNLKNTDFDLNEIITLASIIEREAKLDKERPTISGVFHNRLKTGMRLQSCATVQYILGERKERLTDEETGINSPFNTYINEGLPPSPIASPGEKSLIAAIRPADVDYLFFRLADEDGSHTFTKTYKEHLNAAPKK
ncbi:endolytic transglycosylase MltG [Tissierella creatinophila]|uniref:Endolytic murein transglycosylase n=1 Tax=Tissierella creatinophila DSM 6911 TaxID=1123403 RepID=A0A1U7M9F7_TISCR|nr:endolytic transglycosylase MltG [Tissierella creatinophila]OLS03911.1 putative aminodeoxychorismate lyase [Tissierella creatinophila DSM 6911]